MPSTKLNAGLALSYQASRWILTEDAISEYKFDFIGPAISGAYRCKQTSDFERRILLQALEICARREMLLYQGLAVDEEYIVSSLTLIGLAKGSLNLPCDPGFFRVPYGE